MSLFSDVLALIQSGELIQADKYLHHASTCTDCTYCKSDFIYRRGDWRGNPTQSLRQNTLTKNLVFGHSDKFIGKLDLFYSSMLGYKNIFGINTEYIRNKAHPIPLGLTNSTNESPLHELFGNHSLIIRAVESANPLTEYIGRVSASFSVSTNPGARAEIAKLFEQDFGGFEMPDFSETGRINYLINLGNSNFSVCPVGNGIDTHRLWETLYMGGIPIILKNKVLEPMLKDLPVLVLENWEEMRNHDFLAESWNRIYNGSNYDFSKLSISYWLDFIHNPSWLM